MQDIDPVNLEEDPELDRLIEFWIKIVLKKGQPVHLVLTKDKMPGLKPF